MTHDIHCIWESSTLPRFCILFSHMGTSCMMITMNLKLRSSPIQKLHRWPFKEEEVTGKFFNCLSITYFHAQKPLVLCLGPTLSWCPTHLMWSLFHLWTAYPMRRLMTQTCLKPQPLLRAQSRVVWVMVAAGQVVPSGGARAISRSGRKGSETKKGVKHNAGTVDTSKSGPKAKKPGNVPPLPPPRETSK